MLQTQPLGTLVMTVAAGILSLILAKKSRLPSILFLLVFGVLLGPEFANLVQPAVLGSNFPYYISLMVALILFEGGASLKFAQLQEVSRAVRNLLTIGVLVTLVAISIATRYVAHMSWTKSILFGAIMIVTGPTVVIPILHRVRIKDSLHNILKWEAILIDPLGVVIAVVLFEFFLSEHIGAVAGLGLFFGRIILGTLMGLLAGWVMYFGLTHRKFLRAEGEELGGLFVLATALFFYGVAEWLIPHSGLVTAAAAGIFIGNRKFPFQQQIFHFKQQVTSFALSVLFILISSNVPIRAAGGVFQEGFILIGLMVFVARPASVFLSTVNDQKLSFKDRLFLSSLAPRGIVSATLATLFALAFKEEGIATQNVFLPLSFFVIFGTIIMYASFSGGMAKLLGVHEAHGKGVVIVGANAFGLLLGWELKKRKIQVTFIDTSPAFSGRAKREGFQAFFGSGFDGDFLESLDLRGIGNMIAVTPNHEVNVLSSQTFARFLGRDRVFRLWDKTDEWEGVTSHHYDDSWGRPIVVSSGKADLDIREYVERGKHDAVTKILEQPLKATPEDLAREGVYLPLFVFSNDKVLFVYPNVQIPAGSELIYLPLD